MLSTKGKNLKESISNKKSLAATTNRLKIKKKVEAGPKRQPLSNTGGKTVDGADVFSLIGWQIM
jgi:hypothetical protein